jgi:hypothetical protein
VLSARCEVFIQTLRVAYFLKNIPSLATQTPLPHSQERTDNAVSTHGTYKFSAFGQLLVFSVCMQLILHDRTYRTVFVLRSVLPV